MIITIVASIVGFGLLIFFHELGHFFAAKKLGVKVEKFSLGYGPDIVGFTRGGTRYCISAFPLGGFVKVAGETDAADVSASREFLSSRSPWQRMFLYFMGPVFNFLLAFLLFSAVFMVGVSVYDFQSTVIGKVSDGYPAQTAGLKPGDLIRTINGVNVKDWMEVQSNIRKNMDKSIDIQIIRDKEPMAFSIATRWDSDMQSKIIGISPREELKKFSFFGSIWEGLKQTGLLSYAVIKGLVLVVFGKAKMDVAGPIGIFQMLGTQAHQGVNNFLDFIGFISINLAILNLLPVPIFDGGVILLLLVEAIRRKPVSDKSRRALEYVGIALIATLVVYATFKDIIRIRLR